MLQKCGQTLQTSLGAKHNIFADILIEASLPLALKLREHLTAQWPGYADNL